MDDVTEIYALLGDAVRDTVTECGEMVTDYVVVVETVDSDGGVHLRMCYSDAPVWRTRGMLESALDPVIGS